MSRASKRAGGSISAVAALALSAMGLAALPASATEDETTDVSTVQPTESPEAVEETSASASGEPLEESSVGPQATQMPPMKVKKLPPRSRHRLPVIPLL